MEKWCRGRMGPKEHCCICLIQFWCYFPSFYDIFSWIFEFQELLIIETWKQCNWIWHAWKPYTGGSCLSWIFGEHENLSDLSVIWLIYIKLYRKKEKKIWQKIWAKWESSLTTVWLKWDPPVCTTQSILMHFSSLNQQNMKFLAVCLTPPDKKLKNVNFNREKVFKRLENLYM